MMGLGDATQTQSPNELMRAIDDAIDFTNDVSNAPEGSLDFFHLLPCPLSWSCRANASLAL